MDNLTFQHIVSIKSKWYLHVIYWLFAAILMFFVFSNRDYDLQIRIVLVGILIMASYFTSLLLNHYIIPKFLFKAKFFLFSYLILALFVIFLWIITLLIYLVVTYSAFYLPNLIIPDQGDLIILIVGTYLIIILAAVIHFIKESYRRLVEKNELAEQKKVTDLKFKEAKLKLLQAQIHPHFLFNMLNNLYGLVNESVDNSRDVIMKLSELLDYMLYECDKPKVRLNKEIRFINNYIELERIRHDEHFNVKTSFPDLKDDILIAPLILFPFVENAFKHGFQDSGNSFINIQLSVDNNSLEFNVENSLNKQTEDKYLKLEGKGIGLKNIKERLELIYKDNYLLDVTSIDRKHLIRLKLTIENE